jgi:DNA-binding NarL/FixJ family response regulator
VSSLKILLVDDHSLFRDGLKYVLLQLGDDVEISEAGTCKDAFSHVKGSDFDIILLDLKMPDMTGIEALQRLRKMTPMTPIVILTASEEVHTIRQVMGKGAMGYIPKSLTSEIMIKALQLILEGGRYVPDHALKVSAQNQGPNLYDLTKRQMEILKLLKDGRSNKDIASQLNIADNTVRVHISGIFQVLGVSNRTEAAMIALKEGV